MFSELVAALLALEPVIAKMISDARTARAEDHATIAANLASATAFLAQASADHAARAPLAAFEDAAVDAEDVAAGTLSPKSWSP